MDTKLTKLYNTNILYKIKIMKDKIEHTYLHLNTK